VQEEALRAGARPDGADWGTEPPGQWGELGAGDEAQPVPTEAGAWQQFYAGVVACLRDGAPPPVDPRDAIAVLDVIETAFAAVNARA
jgi:predicted dehydrogenase